MTTEELEQIRKIIREETISKQEYQNGQTEIRAEIKASEERLTKKIETELEETIEVLKEVIHTAYNMHEERIKQLEDQAEQPHKN